MPTGSQIVEGCAACGIVSFRSRSGRVSHCKSIHGQIANPIEPPIIGRLKCPHCTETFAKGSGLSSHLGSRHGRHVGSGAGAGAQASGLDDWNGGGIDDELFDGGYSADGAAGDYIAADSDEDSSSSSSSSRTSASSASSSARHGSASETSKSSSGSSDSDESSRHLSDEDAREQEVNSSEDFVCEADETLFPDIANAETR